MLPFGSPEGLIIFSLNELSLVFEVKSMEFPNMLPTKNPQVVKLADLKRRERDSKAN